MPARFVLSNLVVLEAAPKRLLDGGALADLVTEAITSAHVVSVSDELVARAFHLAMDHTLTGVDAVALATARRVGVAMFVTSDGAILAAAPDIARTPQEALRQLDGP